MNKVASDLAPSAREQDPRRYTRLPTTRLSRTVPAHERGALGTGLIGVSVSGPVCHRVQDRGDSQHQRWVRAGRPRPRRRRRPGTTSWTPQRPWTAVLDGVLVVDDVALDVEVSTIGHLDGPLITQRGDQRLLHRRDGAPVPVFDSIVSRTRATRSWIFSSSLPWLSSRISVLVPGGLCRYLEDPLPWSFSIE